MSSKEAPNDSFDDVFRIEEPVRTPWYLRGDTWSWLFPIFGFCLFESLANPSLGIVVACLKFGYPDLRTAVWLTTDRRFGRGEVHAPFYAARGFFITTACSLVGGVVIALFERQILKNNPFGVLEAMMLSNMSVMIVGFCAAVISSGLGLKLVMERRQPVWIDPTIHQARRQKRWHSVCMGRFNEFPLFCLGLVGLSVLWLSGVVLICIRLFQDPRHAADPVIQRVIECAFAFLIAGAPAVALIYLTIKAWSYAASNPELVWEAEQ